MDSRLLSAIQRIETTIQDLAKAEEIYLNLEASKKSKYALRYLETKGTVGEREAQVLASDDWVTFCKALVTSEVEYQRVKRMLELHFKAFDAEYLSLKNDSQGIARQRGMP